MPTDIPLQCRCGHVRGTATHVSPRSGNRVICYCKDCQAFAHYLERPDAVNAAGGTDIFQMAPADVRIDSGADALRCVRLSDKGMFRFYTECCRTPIGNLIAPNVPFVGLISAFVGSLPVGMSRDEAFGPAVGILGKYAVGGVPAGVHPKMSMGVMLRVMPMLFGWWIKGRGAPSPFVDAQTKAIAAPLKVLTPQERAGL